MIDRCAAQGVNPGYALGRDYPEYEDGLLVAITEQRTRADIDRLADVLGGARGRRAQPRCDDHAWGRAAMTAATAADDQLTIYERSKPGRRAFVAPALDVPEHPLDDLIPARLRRAEAARAARGLRARDRAPLQPPVQAQLRPRHGLLPARARAR